MSSINHPPDHTTMATQRTRTQAAPIKLTELPAECLEVVFEQLDLKDR